MTRPLVATSIDVIAANQAGSGAYIAAPGYDTYGYSWLRDGAFIAAAMDAHGQHESAGAFHDWVARTVERYAHKVELLEDRVRRGGSLGSLDDEAILHTRFTIDGSEVGQPWGDFQLDGYGFWLSGVGHHLALTRKDPRPYARTIDLVRRYLTILWEQPSFDCWEEYPTRCHVTTWAAIAKGLDVSAGSGGPDAAGTTVAERITGRLAAIIEPSGILRKFVPRADALDRPDETVRQLPRTDSAVAGHERAGRELPDDAIDGSALLVIGDMGPYPTQSRVAQATVRAVLKTLVVGGGVHRYVGDEYYGGGLWVVLAGALAAAIGSSDPGQARDILDWIETSADETGQLPEQVESHLLEPQLRTAWVDRWGPIAQPLLWSHAMYLRACAVVHPMS